MENINDLSDNIERTRKLLINIIKTKEKLTDPVIITISQHLDNLLNQYARQYMTKKN